MEQNTEKIALEIICLMEEVKRKMEELRNTPITDTLKTWDRRALSIAITELETSQLWLANARPE